MKRTLILEAEDLEPLARDFERFLGEVNGGYLSAVAGEVERVGADAATDLEDFLCPSSGQNRRSGGYGIRRNTCGLPLRRNIRASPLAWANAGYYKGANSNNR